ncbi:FAD-binding oxidoreductase [Modestobacter roseus]|uniref:Glycolate oxidase n=1 Tax=Modestobacter roseus TaxID=1181884 RepID=A0A562IME5_9ACTN|nr:FAD-linked oxidase C-terminal domain-containing protein [Modestobacter roseus]MQA34975.1 FAD-binding protein [Modestobacter roseus]TWH72187.1 glycolate oxidase [Modestobacter roseus]
MEDTVAQGAPVELLRTALPDGVVVTDPAVVEGYRHDWSRLPDAGWPVAVVRAESAAHVQTAVRWAAEHRVPVTVRGAGTSLAGGATAVDGCLLLSTERMTAIEIDPVDRTAVVGPGALNAAVKDAAAAHGLWYPPDPGSFRISSIGGNVATNAGGICCVKYGVTTDYVQGIDVVLADGRLITLGGRTVKDVAGLPLLKLFVGSEGTLGVITRVVLRLVPQPHPAGTLVAYFDTPRDAARAVVAMGSRVRPSMLELMDSASINAVEDLRAMGLDRDAGALLVGQSDAPGGARAGELAVMTECCEAAGATTVFATDDPVEGDLFLEARRAVGPAIEVRGAALHEDICVPVHQLPTAMARIEEIAATFQVEIPVFAHAGDGNLHPVIVHRPGDEEGRARALQAFDAVLQVALECGGTITGEHGVGRTKRAALLDQLDADVMDVGRRVRSALDPLGILNPGVLW